MSWRSVYFSRKLFHEISPELQREVVLVLGEDSASDRYLISVVNDLRIAGYHDLAQRLIDEVISTYQEEVAS